MEEKIDFSTDTATIAIFDPKAMEHRMSDTADWWSSPFEELDEINDGNMVLVGLGEDGSYVVSVTDTEFVSDEYSVSALIKCISGNIFVGPGEELPAEGFAPFRRPYTLGKKFELPSGTYRVVVRKKGFNIDVALLPEDAMATNQLVDQLLLE